MAKKRINKGETIIKVENVSKSFKLYYDKGRSLKEKILFWKRNRHEVREVLKDISFEVKKGDSIGLIGRNGCGKSTLLKMLTKIYYPNKGTIDIKGRVSSLIELGAGFHPDMTGRENIYINASIFGLTKEDIEKRIKEIIEFSELGDYIDNPVRTYSSGMYMRLAFSVAINVDADILLIDEILGVGDSNFQAKCYKKMKELKDSGITFALVSHSMQNITDFCDQCLWIEHGNIKEMGPTSVVSNHYIDYMNDEAIMKTLNEQDRMAVQDEVNRKQQDINFKILLEKRKRGLDTSMEHYGTHQGIITSVKLIDKDGEETHTFESNKPFTIKSIFKFEKEYKNVYFVLGFLASDERTLLYQTQAKLISNHITMTTKDLPLPAGDYYLKIGVETKTQPLDVYNKYLKFHIQNKKKEKGNYSIKFEIK